MLNEIFQAFLITSFAGAVLTLLLALLKPVTKKFFSYSWQYYVWLGVLVVLLIPIRLSLPEREGSGNEGSTVNAEFTAQNENLPQQNGQTSISEQSANNSQDTYQTTLPDILADTEYNSSGAMPDTPVNSSGSTVDHTVSSPAVSALWQKFSDAAAALWAAIADSTPVLSVIWVLGILGTLFFTLAGYWKLVHTVNADSQPVTCTALTAYTKKSLAVYRCKAVASPFILGLFHPALILPDKELSKEQLDNILRHEMTHFNRNDLWYKWFAVLVRCLHWFNPAVYYVVKQINTECEISCDLSVVKNMNREEELCYVNTILSLLTPQSHTMPLTTGMTGSKKSLKQRFTMIKNKKNTTRLMIIVSIILALLILLVALLASGTLSDLAKKETMQPQETPIPTAAATLTPELTPEPTAAVTRTPESTPTPEPTLKPGTPLTKEEIRWFNEEFFVSYHSSFGATRTNYPGTWVRNNLLAEEFDTPAQVNVENMFYMEDEYPVPEEITYLKLETLHEEIGMNRLSADYINELLQYYLGITLPECENVELASYYPEVNAFYFKHGDVFANHIKVTEGYRLGDMITLYYHQTLNLNPTDAELSELPLYVTTLKDTGDHYQFRSNKRVVPQSSDSSENEWMSVSTKVNGYVAKDVDRRRSDILLPALSYVSRSHYDTPRNPGVSHWRINSLEQKAVYAQLSNTKLHLYEVDFYLLAKQPERIEDFDCIRKTSDGWFVTDDTIHHYLIYEEAENGALTHLTSWQEASTPYETGFTDKLKTYLATVLDDGIRDDLVSVSYMDSHAAVVDYVEWVVDNSDRSAELGWDEDGDMPNGYGIYNPVRRFEILPLAENAVIEIFPPGYGDWIQTTPEECLENCQDTLFHITIENGKIVHMREQYVP